MLTDEERARIAELEKKVFDSVDAIVNADDTGVGDKLRAISVIRLNCLLSLLKHADPDGMVSGTMKESADRVMTRLDEAIEKITWPNGRPAVLDDAEEKLGGGG